jgi:hypothetical protein
MKTLLKTLAALVLVALGGGQALGCATCFGQSDSEMAKGMNAGIFVLLGFVALFWAAFGSFFVFIVRRAQNTGEVLPGDQHDPQHN